MSPKKKPDADKFKGPSGRAVDKAHAVAMRPMPLTLLVKLGSIAVHADEMLSPKAHVFDEVALRGLLTDPDVTAWIKSMGALLPEKR